MRKKLIAVLLCICMVTTMIPTAFAADAANIEFNIPNTDVEVGDELIVTISSKAMTVSTFGSILDFDNTKLELVAMEGQFAGNRDVIYLDYNDDFGSPQKTVFDTKSTLEESNTNSKVSLGILAAFDRTYLATKDFATLKFKVLASGDATFKLREKSSGVDGHSEAIAGTQVITIKGEEATTYSLTVSHGLGGGDYEENEVVDIEADPAPTGKQFKNWTSNNGGTFGDANSESTTFTMPANSVVVTANYEDIPVATIKFDAKGGTGTMADVQVNIGDIYEVPACTFTAPAGKEFAGWWFNYDTDNNGTFDGGFTSAKQPGDDVKINYAQNKMIPNWEDIPVTTEKISAVSATLSTPIVGETIGDITVTSGEPTKYDVHIVSFSEGGGKPALSNDTLIKADISYLYALGFTAKEGYEFAGTNYNTMTATVNGEYAQVNDINNSVWEYIDSESGSETPVTVTSIAIKTPATKTEYKIGDSLDVTDLVITATKSDSSKEDVTVTDSMVTGFDSSAVATSQTLTITYQGQTATYDISIAKIDASKPAKPTLDSKTHNSITVVTESGQEYSIDGGAWQESGEFTGLTAETEYKITTRIKETAITNASAESSVLKVTTEAEPAVTHTIKASSGANGTITPDGSVKVADKDDQLFIFTPDSGYEIDTVTIDEKVFTKTPSGYTFENVTKDHTIKVTFKKTEAPLPKEYDVKVDLNGGNGSPSGAGSYKVGDTVTIKAGTRSGYDFDSWTITSGSATLANKNNKTTTFEMPDGDVNIKANWDKQSSGGSGSSSSGSSVVYYDIEIDVKGEGTVKPDGGNNNIERVARNSTKTFTFTPDEGYEIADVIVNDESVGAVESYKFEKITKDQTLEVVFEEIDTTITEGWKNPFIDVHVGDWFYQGVKYVHMNGLMDGTTAITFEPYANTTRSMVWTVIARMADADITGGELWYSKAQDWAMENQVSDGTNPDDFITREQFVTMLWRNDGKPTIADYEGLTVFTDVSEISDYAQLAMVWAHAEGIIQGKADDVLDPKGEMTRGEMAVILQRYLSVK